MRSKLKIILIMSMVFTLIIVSSIGSIAFAKDRIQDRDRDCLDSPKQQYCDNKLDDCDQVRLRKCISDFDCENERLRSCFMDLNSEWCRLRMTECMLNFLLDSTD